MKSSLRNSALLVLVAALGAAAYSAGRADATGVPVSDPLYYGGVLEEDGTLIEGSRALTINIWQRVDSVDDADRLCSADFPDAQLSQGRFRVALPASCLEAVRTRTELWSEIEVDGMPVGRAKIAALPYAVSAEYALRSVDARAAEASHLNFHVAGSMSADGVISAPNGTSTFLEDLTISAGGNGDTDSRLSAGTGAQPSVDPNLQVFDDRVEVRSLATDSLNPPILRPRGETKVGTLESPRFASPAIVESPGQLNSGASTWENVTLPAGVRVASGGSADIEPSDLVPLRRCPDSGVLVAVQVQVTDLLTVDTRYRCSEQ